MFGEGGGKGAGGFVEMGEEKGSRRRGGEGKSMFIGW